ncbi:hypothetical protein FKV68_23580 (plasmid) [Sinorhizobium mexicanum]|uniref:Uncharacterized protein n=1 Tax=Sinorhizobium mexicanum TaxID=375549 RepID=A0A859R007_9HYPH|nr:hypothetical protein FKV68_23580 [Sinorhizobium mexicanum]
MPLQVNVNHGHIASITLEDPSRESPSCGDRVSTAQTTVHLFDNHFGRNESSPYVRRFKRRSSCRLRRAGPQPCVIGPLAADVAAWVLMLTPQKARRKTGMGSKHFWLRKLLQNCVNLLG